MLSWRNTSLCPIIWGYSPLLFLIILKDLSCETKILEKSQNMPINKIVFHSACHVLFQKMLKKSVVHKMDFLTQLISKLSVIHALLWLHCDKKLKHQLHTKWFLLRWNQNPFDIRTLISVPHFRSWTTNCWAISQWKQSWQSSGVHLLKLGYG